MPKLVSVELENFQTLKKHVVIPISNLTLLFGPNGAGKSAIFDALTFMKKISSYEWGDDSKNIDSLIKRWARKNNGSDSELEFGIGLKFQTPKKWGLDHHPDMFRLNKVWMSSLDNDYSESLLNREFRIYLRVYGTKYDGALELSRSHQILKKYSN